MRRIGLLVACTLFVGLAASLISAAEVSEVIPDDVLVAIVIKDGTALHDKVVSLADKIVDDGGKNIPDFWDAFLSAAKLGNPAPAAAPNAAPAPASVIDRKRSVGMLLASPGDDRDMNAIAVLMIPVSDYTKFLKEVAQARSTPEDVRTPGQSVDGFDLVGEDQAGVGLYFQKHGDYAFVAQSGAALKTFARNAKPLSQTLAGQSKKTFTDSDVSVYLNCDQAVKSYDAEIKQAVAAMQAQMKAGAGQAPIEGLDPAKIANAEVNVLLEVANQTDNSVIGINLNPTDIQVTCLVTALPNSMLSNCLAAQKTGELKLMSTFDKDAWMAGCIHHAPGSWKLAQDRIIQFMTDSGLAGVMKNFNIADYTAMLTEMDQLATGDIAFALYPPVAPNTGLFNGVEIVASKDPERVRAIVAKYAASQMATLKNLNGMIVTTTQTANVEPGIDMTVTEFKVDDAAADNPVNKQMAVMMKAIYGDKIVIYDMVAGKNVIVGFGDPTTKTIKAVAAKVTSGQTGDLTTNPGYVKAFEGMPAPRNAACYLTLTGTINALAPSIITQMGGPAMKLQMPATGEESGLASSVVITDNVARIDTKIPVQEIVNVRKMIEKAIADMQGGGAPAPEPAPAPVPAPAPGGNK